jgi:uncharacterized damage-inducible protein DinB
MDVISLLKQQIAMSQGDWSGLAQQLTEEQFNYQPPGRCNAISATLLHMFGIEDCFIQAKLLNQHPLWVSEAWGEKVGVKDLPGLDNQWVEVKQSYLAIAPVVTYGQAVHSATNRYLETLTPAGLEQPVMMGGRPGTAAELLSILVIHNFSHAGEICVLKGLHGLQGQPV